MLIIFAMVGNHALSFNSGLKVRNCRLFLNISNLELFFHKKQSPFHVAAETLAKAYGGALGEMISKIHSYKKVGLKMYTKTFQFIAYSTNS